SQFAHPTIAGTDTTQTGNVTALQFDQGDLGMNVVGNVLGTASVNTAYDAYDNGTISIFELGSATDISATSLFRHGNYDAVHADVIWNPGTPQALPPSLYLHGRPAWWPSDASWPWVGPDTMPMTGVLPAKARSDAIGN